jgi:hypothetical protein
MAPVWRSRRSGWWPAARLSAVRAAGLKCEALSRITLPFGISLR